jgi:SAM-dependent methyltransferase
MPLWSGYSLLGTPGRNSHWRRCFRESHRACSLANEVHLDAAFVHSDLYELPNVLSGQFDIVYTSYGVVGWLADLRPWGLIIARYLKPGGFFDVAEGHPFMWVFGDQSADFKVAHSYFSCGPVTDDWNHTFCEIIMALLSAALRIEFLHEFPFCAWENFPEMERGDDRFRRMSDPNKDNLIPMMFSLKATKPG